MDYKEKESIGKVIKMLRTSHNIEIKDLAKRSRVSRWFIQGLENCTGNVSATKLDLIS